MWQVSGDATSRPLFSLLGLEDGLSGLVARAAGEPVGLCSLGLEDGLLGIRSASLSACCVSWSEVFS